MKIIVTSHGTGSESLVAARFGRGKYFLVFDTESDQWEPVTLLNEGAQAGEDAGIQAAQTVIAMGAEAVVASHCGTRAFELLDKGGVKIYPVSGKTAAEVVEGTQSWRTAGIQRTGCVLSV